jgi:hypothetical protein
MYTPNPLVEKLGEELIRDVRDAALRHAANHLFGTWAEREQGDIYRELCAKLSDEQKDLLWRLLSETVEGTLGRAVYFVEHNRIVRRIRVLFRDPITGEESDPLAVTGVDSIDLQNEYWWQWLEKYPRIKTRPPAPPPE